LESEETSRYQVEYTTTADGQFYKVVDFFYRQHTLERAEQMVDELEELAQSLEYLPDRGAIEKWLENRSYEYRFLLYKRTKRADVKIIYFVDEDSKMVFVTDFFPTEKDVEELLKRNK
jgi:mRNA-degrading endonuclease RelE of RelBE toxin-antitoxin system